MHRRTIHLLLLLLLAAIVLVYWPGLNGDFTFDDRPNILDNPHYKFKELTWDALVGIVRSGDAGTLKRPIPMLSFALNVASTGFLPFHFKLWNLGIHVLNTLLVYWVVALLIRVYRRCSGIDLETVQSEWIALGAAALWGLHPLNLTSVLYVVQRMNSLCAMFSLLAIAAYLVGRIRIMEGHRNGWRILLLGSGGATLLALLCKENAALIPLYIATIEGILLRYSAADARDAMLLKLFFWAVVSLTLITAAAIVLLHPPVVFSSYVFREFSPEERLLTQARVIFFYLQMLIAPVNAQLGLFHDDFVNSTGLLQPPVTALAVTGIIALVAVAFATARRHPVLSFAISWFLVGHLLESTVLPLEMIHEHRNYLPLVGPLVAVSYNFISVRFSSHTFVLHGLFVAAALALAVVTWSRAYVWGNLIRHSEYEVANHPNSQRSAIQLGRIYFTLYSSEGNEAYFEEARRHFQHSVQLPGLQLGGYVGLFRLYYQAKREPPPQLLEEFIGRLASESAAPSVLWHIQNLSNCNMFENCRIPDEVMVRMFDALLKNEKVQAEYRALTSILLAQYLVDKLGDGFSGIKVLEHAKQIEPRQIGVRRNLVRVYRLSGQFELAAAELAEVRALDRFRSLGSELDQEEVLLKEAIDASKSDKK